ncbi:MAG: hypothetical protein PHY93_20275 [Bacteriovorax sp.]|nr:hypothetical protein [Bacteriovorax sp.]
MIIISDANIIVYFWKAGLLAKLHDSVETIVPEKIFTELTQGRIRRSYPELSEHMNQHKYNTELPSRIKVKTIEHEESSTLNMHDHIKESGLDDGEIDGIMLSVLLGYPFVTNDSEAIIFFNDVLDHNSNGRAEGFEAFLDDFLARGHIDQGEHRLLLDEKTK